VHRGRTQQRHNADHYGVFPYVDNNSYAIQSFTIDILKIFRHYATHALRSHTIHTQPALLPIKESIVTKIEKVLFSGNTHTTVNRDPNVQRGEHGVVDLKLSAPGGESVEFIGTEPHPRAEQLFAGAWSACYITAFGIAASLKKVTLPSDYSVDIQVNIGQTGADWLLGAQFTIRVPGLATEVVEAIAHLAHQICPYSKAVHGNIEVGLNIVTA
jgi:lipoyl-dependent peroxiredoxin